MKNKQVGAYASRNLKVHEKHYCTYVMELATISFALKIERHYLYGCNFDVLSDHKSLKYLFDQKELKGLKLLEDFRDLDLNLDSLMGKMQYGMIIVDNKLMNEIKGLQAIDEAIQGKRKLVETSKAPEFKMGPDNILRCNKCICVPDNTELRKTTLDEVHKRKLSIHPCTTNMYKDLKQRFWWLGMKK
ncbi:uncharacterized protein [Cicer arietinum]|uniref:Uncharacterized protein LOC113784490 n=1 Tax=Cicer arietinum TaxID=3827 RepID=A0A3Q7YBE7_CICAR|nr:uncharacterized protein LOC113784490 [Cicer arietinum]